MLRLNILQFLEPTEFVKFALLNRQFHRIVDENGFKQEIGEIAPGYLDQVRHVLSNQVLVDDGNGGDGSQYVPKKVSLHFIEILKRHRKVTEEISKMKHFNRERFSHILTQDEMDELDIDVELLYQRPLIRNCLLLKDLAILKKK